MKSLTFKKYTRRVNHIVAYLDRVTVFERIRKDDLTVADLLDSFTLAQILEFIDAAAEANATGIQAALLEYRNRIYPGYAAVDSLTLDL